MNVCNSKGIYLALATALISGVSVFVNKFAVDSIKPPLVFTTTKNLAVGFIIVGLVLVFKKWRGVLQLGKRDIVKLILIAIIGGSIPFYLFFSGLALTSAVNGAIIQKTLVFWVALFAAPFLKERISLLQVTAILLLFWGNVFIGGFKGFSYSTGELYILLATIFWAGEHVLAKKVLEKIDPDIVTAARMGLGSLILLGMSLVVSPKGLAGVGALSGAQYLWLGVTVVFLLAYVMTWYRALAAAPAVVVSSVLVLATLVTNILSAVFVTHTWSIEMLYQGILIGLGTVLFVVAIRRQARVASACSGV